jgi:sortase A
LRPAHFHLSVIALALTALATSAHVDSWRTGGPDAIADADSVAGHVIDMSYWSATRIAAYRKNVRPGQKPEATLKIPSIALVVPVFAGTSEAILDRGAGRIEGTSQFGASGNTGIAAHRDGFFRALRLVKVGDLLQIELPEITLTYKIVSTRVVDPSETSVLGPMDEPTITLVTCYPFYFVGSAPQRFIVHATRVSSSEEIRLARARR